MKKIFGFTRRLVPVAILITVIAVIIGSVYSNRVFNEISDNVMRLHVIANSDSAEDQALKLKVRDAVIAYTQSVTGDCGSVEEVLDIVSSESENIEKAAQECLIKEGSEYDAEVYIGEYYFPAKSYGQYSFPSGDYCALRVVIGEGQGKNWWCVLFPPLCYLSAGSVQVNTEEDDILREYLPDEAYSVVNNSANISSETTQEVKDSAGVDGSKVTVKFKVVEMFQSAVSFVKNIFG
ncbi:MAG: stage II sporulation protein R [Clostridia bacterium]|nr:stage II sporulation protein R [Clostridia bacterium]